MRNDMFPRVWAGSALVMFLHPIGFQNNTIPLANKILRQIQRRDRSLDRLSDFAAFIRQWSAECGHARFKWYVTAQSFNLNPAQKNGKGGLEMRPSSPRLSKANPNRN